MSFETVTIVDTVGDETTVDFNGEEIVVKVRDQALTPHLTSEADDAGMDYAIGTYTIEAARELRDALDRAITAANDARYNRHVEGQA